MRLSKMLLSQLPSMWRITSSGVMGRLRCADITALAVLCPCLWGLYDEGVGVNISDCKTTAYCHYTACLYHGGGSMCVVTGCRAIAQGYGLKAFAGGDKGFLALRADHWKVYSGRSVYAIEFNKLADALAGAVKKVANLLKCHVVCDIEFFKHIFGDAGVLRVGFVGPDFAVFFHKASLNKLFTYIIDKKIDYVKQ